MTELKERVRQVFTERFGAPPDYVARAPGRVNLLGGHVDYNEGFVLPVTVNREVLVAAHPRDDGRVNWVAADLGLGDSFDVRGPIAPSEAGMWANYVRGVAEGLRRAGYPLRGLDAVMAGDVPIGAGLSSSAAVEMAALVAFEAAGGFQVPRDEAARIGQRAEHEFVGTRCGIMDQLASACGQEGHALLIDCRDLSVEPVPLPEGMAILVADTTVRRELASSEYNARRAQCEEVARTLGVAALRDATLEMLEADALTPILEQRARHVVMEIARTQEGVRALRSGDVARFGQLMRECHNSLRDLYEVSSPELEVMVKVLCAQPGCHGARLTGAGFGGCVAAVVDSAEAEAVASAAADTYEMRMGIRPPVYVCLPSRGAGLL
jgi:galactokinase